MHPDERALRTRPPFFSRRSTARLIREIAAQKNLIVYVGAGVTISETGASWRAMIRHLMSGFEVDEAERKALFALSDVLPPLQQASIVWHHYRRSFGATHALGQLQESIAQQIYRTNQWRSGDYSAATVLMCSALRSAGANVTVVTTNYDNYLEQASDILRIEHGEDKISRLRSIVAEPFTEPVADDKEGASAQTVLSVGSDYEDLEQSEEYVPVIHVHGVLEPREIITISTGIVFSEADYENSQEDVAQEIEAEFHDSAVLILGSGLDDPPLLRALARTVDGVAPRWAVYPRAAMPRLLKPYETENPGSAEDIARQFTARAEEFGLELIVPDFYSQASQFVREVAHAAVLSAGGRMYRVGSGTDYDRRLTDWWNAWEATNLEPGRRIAQQHAHTRLANELPLLRLVINALDDRVKLELWVRWRPSTDNRHLQLWASSTGTWPDTHSARRVPIQEDSPYAAVEAFTRGQVLLSKTLGRSDRWERYFAVPIRTKGPFTSQVVGVLTLAVSNDGNQTQVSEKHPEVLEALGRRMVSLGRELLVDKLSKPSPS